MVLTNFLIALARELWHSQFPYEGQCFRHGRGFCLPERHPRRVRRMESAISGYPEKSSADESRMTWPEGRARFGGKGGRLGPWHSAKPVKPRPFLRAQACFPPTPGGAEHIPQHQ